MSPLDPLHGNTIRTPSGLPQPQQQGQEVQRTGGRLPNIPEGTLVRGVVLSAEGDGTYLVRVLGQQLKALANLPLVPGQRFQAVWEKSQGMPVLRLTPSDLSLLRTVPLREQPLALALLSRGLPLSEEVLSSLRAAWSQMGGGEQTPAPLAELWARGLPLTSENVQILLWYLNLQDEQINKYWKRLKENVRRLGKEKDFSSWTLKDLAEEDPELLRFLWAHGMLSAPAREGVDPSLLAPAFWPLGESESSLARVNVKKEKRGERTLWRVHFDMEGTALGAIRGHLASDEKALAVALGAEEKKALRFLRSHQKELEAELRELPLSLASLVMFFAEEEPEASYRAIDMEA